MNLRELRDAHRHLFYDQTEWWDGEAFMEIALEPLAAMPVRAIPCKVVPDDMLDELTDAVLLAHCYVRDPQNAIWSNYLWTGDVDRYGQRVFVGNPHGKGFEIHREIKKDHRFKFPLFT